MVFSTISCKYYVNARNLYNTFYTKDAASDDIPCVIKTFLYIQKIEFCSLLMFYAKCTQSILHYKI